MKADWWTPLACFAASSTMSEEARTVARRIRELMGAQAARFVWSVQVPVRRATERDDEATQKRKDQV